MATPLGTNVVTSIVKQYILPKIVDNIYDSNPLFFRINQSKRFIKGGTQIEIPVMHSRFTNGGSYEGFDVLDVAPNDTVRTVAFDWKQYYVPVSVDGLTLIKTDSPEAIADHVKLQMAQAEMEMAENLGADIWSDTVGDTALDGLRAAISDTNPTGGNYGGIDRTANSWWQSQTGPVDWNSSPLPALNTAFTSASEGGRHPTIILTSQADYNAYWNLAVGTQTTYQTPVAYDEQLFSAGFTNLIFNGVPWVVDSHCPAAEGYMVNEEYLFWAVSSRADMRIEPFQTPITQDAMATKMLWAGALMFGNIVRQCALTFSNTP